MSRALAAPVPARARAPNRSVLLLPRSAATPTAWVWAARLLDDDAFELVVFLRFEDDGAFIGGGSDAWTNPPEGMDDDKLVGAGDASSIGAARWFARGLPVESCKLEKLASKFMLEAARERSSYKRRTRARTHMRNAIRPRTNPHPTAKARGQNVLLHLMSGASANLPR